MQTTCSMAGRSNAHRMSVHSLRHGGAQEASLAGTNKDVATHGNWHYGLCAFPSIQDSRQQVGNPFDT